MTTQIQPTVSRPAAKPGKHLAWLMRVVNGVVIFVGIYCGYSLALLHHLH